MESFNDVICAMEKAVDSILNEGFADNSAFTNGWIAIDKPGVIIRVPPKLLVGDDNVQMDINGRPVTRACTAIAEFATSITDTLLDEMKQRNLRIVDSKRYSLKYVSLFHQYKDNPPEKAISDDIIERFSRGPWMLVVEFGLLPVDVATYEKLSLVFATRKKTSSGSNLGSIEEMLFNEIEKKAGILEKLLGWNPLNDGLSGTINFNEVISIVDDVVHNVAWGMLENEEISEKIEILKPILERLAKYGKIVKVRPYAEAPVLRAENKEAEKEFAIKALKAALTKKELDKVPVKKPNLKFYISIPAATRQN